MSIQSFLIIPKSEHFKTVHTFLKNQKYCEVEHSSDYSTLILITDSPSIEEDKIIEESLKSQTNILSYSLVCGFDTNSNDIKGTFDD